MAQNQSVSGNIRTSEDACRVWASSLLGSIMILSYQGIHFNVLAPAPVKPRPARHTFILITALLSDPFGCKVIGMNNQANAIVFHPVEKIARQEHDRLGCDALPPVCFAIDLVRQLQFVQIRNGFKKFCERIFRSLYYRARVMSDVQTFVRCSKIVLEVQSACQWQSRRHLLDT